MGAARVGHFDLLQKSGEGNNSPKRFTITRDLHQLGSRCGRKPRMNSAASRDVFDLVMVFGVPAKPHQRW
jgi:hypothetical protein